MGWTFIRKWCWWWWWWWGVVVVLVVLVMEKMSAVTVIISEPTLDHPMFPSSSPRQWSEENDQQRAHSWVALEKFTPPAE